MNEFVPVVASGISLVVAMLSAVLAFRSVRAKAPRSEVLLEWAREATAYAEQMGGPDKLGHALGYFEVRDAREKRYDFSHAEARVAIESVLGSKR